MTTPLDLDAIQARADKATPGPWDIFTIASEAGTSSRIFREGELPVDLAHIPMDWNGEGENAAFIAHARADVPALVAEARALRAEVAREREEKETLLSRMLAFTSETPAAPLVEELIERLQEYFRGPPGNPMDEPFPDTWRQEKLARVKVALNALATPTPEEGRDE
jgi:hypothetical protein